MANKMPRNIIVLVLALVVLGGLFFILRPNSDTGSPRILSFDLLIQNDKMAPAEITLNKGDKVTFRVTADKAMEFHLHGYDLQLDLSPGESSTLQFDATLTGQFGIEEESTSTELGKLIVLPSGGG